MYICEISVYESLLQELLRQSTVIKYPRTYTEQLRVEVRLDEVIVVVEDHRVASVAIPVLAGPGVSVAVVVIQRVSTGLLPWS